MAPRHGLFALLAFASAACGSAAGEKRVPLQPLMVQMDLDAKEVERSLGRPAEALSYLRKLEQASVNPAFEQILERSPALGTKEEHDELWTDYRTKLSLAIEAAERGDGGALQAAYLKARMSCEVCHSVFRPQPPAPR
jgi:hypothetical protein